MNKQQLASRIWESANKMRSKIEANDYKDYILGFIFYKFLSDKEVKYLESEGWTKEFLPELKEDDEETRRSVQSNIGYFIEYQNLFSTWLAKGKDFSVQDVRDGLSAFNRLINPAHKKVFEGIFDTLQTGLSKLGESSAAQSKAISDLFQLIKDIPMDGKQDYDVLGFIYEYLISNFAANAGKKAGEFYTPHEVSLLMSEIVADHLKDRDKIEIYDPTSGSGSLLINIGKCVSKYIDDEDNIKYYAQEFKQNTYNLTRMNLIMRGILPDNIATRNGDTLEEDWPYFDESDPVGSYNPLYVDAVVSNPPYSQAWNPEDKENDPRYKRFGLAPKGKADYAFLLHDLYHIKRDGIMTIVLPHGVLFRGGEEGEIRRNLIEENHIDAIIGLPANIFFGTGIPTIVMVLKQSRPNTDVLIVDASKGFAKIGKNNVLRASDIKKIVDVVTQRASVEKFSKLVTREEIRSNDYNLNIPRYVDSSEEMETWDLYASMFGGIPSAELNGLKAYWEAFPSLKEDLFREVRTDYLGLKQENVKEVINTHPDILKYTKHFSQGFEDFETYLDKTLVNDMMSLNLSKTEIVIAEDIFTRLTDIPLVDRYEAYELLHQHWNEISIDIEIIQTEGFEATKKVDPKLVIKKNKGKDVEVQEGWAGRVLPFDLVQKELLTEERKVLESKENRLLEIGSEVSELFENLTEEEKEMDFAGENAFVSAEVKKVLKAKVCEAETLEKLVSFDKLMTEEKGLKSEIKKLSGEMEAKTKELIESMSDEQVKELLKIKWTKEFVQSILRLPVAVQTKLVSEIEKLSKKYETTFQDLEKEISQTERELSKMIDELTGSEADMLGLKEFQRLLGVQDNE